MVSISIQKTETERVTSLGGWDFGEDEASWFCNEPERNNEI